MTEQLTIAGGIEDPSVNLTERQRYALEKIRELGPIPSDELGAWMHERRGRHDAGIRCTFCSQEGRGVGGELRKKKLVKQRRGEGWVLVGAKPVPAPDGGYDPATAEIPF